MVPVTVTADGILEIHLFREIPVVRARLHGLGLFAVALGVAGHVSTELRADEAELCFVGRLVFVAVAAVAVGASHPMQIVDAASEILRGSRQFSPRGEMTAHAIRFDDRQRIAGFPPAGQPHGRFRVPGVHAADRRLLAPIAALRVGVFLGCGSRRGLGGKQGGTGSEDCDTNHNQGRHGPRSLHRRNPQRGVA